MLQEIGVHSLPALELILSIAFDLRASLLALTWRRFRHISPESTLPQPNYRQQKKQREQAKKKKNDEKLRRKGRPNQPSNQESLT
jgi:hypothetical protein